jgi:hypothetical protein
MVLKMYYHTKVVDTYPGTDLIRLHGLMDPDL